LFLVAASLHHMSWTKSTVALQYWRPTWDMSCPILRLPLIKLPWAFTLWCMTVHVSLMGRGTNHLIPQQSMLIGPCVLTASCKWWSKSPSMLRIASILIGRLSSSHMWSLSEESAKLQSSLTTGQICSCYLFILNYLPRSQHNISTCYNIVILCVNTIILITSQTVPSHHHSWTYPHNAIFIHLIIVI